MKYLETYIDNHVPYGTWIKENTSFLILCLLIVSIPFSIRHVFKSPTSFQTGAYSDFTSFSIYISDFLLILLFFFNSKKLSLNRWVKLIYLSLIWVIVELLINSYPLLSLHAYFSFRFLALLLLALCISSINIKPEQKHIIAWIMTILASFQSIIAIFQFSLQKSIGLYMLGESHLGSNLYGVAKIVTHGTKYIRGYGTFPHSNLLAAFLAAAIILNLYLLTKNYQKLAKFILNLSCVLNIFSLFITFSRSGIGTELLMIVLLILFFIWKSEYKLLKSILVPVIIGIGLSVGLLYPYLTTRATISDSAVKERLFYNKIGAKMIQAMPVMGTGLGTSVLHMEQFSEVKLEPWEIQPIHNYYLLSYAEWGIGSIILLITLIYPIYLLIKKLVKIIKNPAKDLLWPLSLSLIGASFIIMFIFDHFFYTIWPTQLLLWIFIGLIANENKLPLDN